MTAQYGVLPVGVYTGVPVNSFGQPDFQVTGRLDQNIAYFEKALLGKLLTYFDKCPLAGMEPLPDRIGRGCR